MIIYLHGYGSSGSGDTATKIKARLPMTVTPTYDWNDPCKSLNKLLDLIDTADDSENVTIIASSLGGWYAEKLASVRNVDLVLYNPSTEPAKSLKKYGLSDKILDSYAILSTKDVRPGLCRYVIVSEDDDVVNPYPTFEKYKHTAAFIHTSGGHRMTDRNLDIIIDRVNFLLNNF